MSFIVFMYVVTSILFMLRIYVDYTTKPLTRIEVVIAFIAILNMFCMVSVLGYLGGVV